MVIQVDACPSNKSGNALLRARILPFLLLYAVGAPQEDVPNQMSWVTVSVSTPAFSGLT